MSYFGKYKIFKVLFLSFFILLFMPSRASAKPNYPDSSVFAGIDWDDKNNIIRLANGSDNWPVTWAADGNLYGAGGDGPGCGGSRKSLWISRFTGDPPDISCSNIIALEDDISGRRGKKGSGILSVDGILYLLIRNADRDGHGCELQSSTDNGRSWSHKWTMNQFGYCTFLNFGKDYSGARDNYVYIYSHDNRDAYVAADRFILMRVPKNNIAEDSDYEFFSGTAGNPSWSSNAGDRRAVFVHDNNALRSGISYHAPSGRYLWWQQNGKNGPDTRYGGGFGIYDAPEPWGPWSIVYYTDNWDTGPGDTGAFASKWMSSDGQTAWLVFSGNDSFSVRKATFRYDNGSTPPPDTNTPTQIPNQETDLDADGDTDFVDFGLLIADFGSSYDIYDYNEMVREY